MNELKKVPFIEKICKNKCPNFNLSLQKVSFEFTSNDLNKIEFMLLGANPGKDEAIVGRPFIGKSGRFLRECLEEVDFSHSVIANAILCSTSNTNNIPNFNKCLKICSVHWFYVLKKLQNVKCLICFGEVAFKSVKYVFNIEEDNVKFSKFNYLGKVKRKEIEVDLFILPHPSYMIRKGYDKETYCSYLIKILEFFNKKENISKKLDTIF